MKAAGAWNIARCKLSTPSELGRGAFNHAQSGRGFPARSDKASLIASSKATRLLNMIRRTCAKGKSYLGEGKA